MAAWIFQCDPDRFDIDGFLSTATKPFTWLVTRYKKEIRPGDIVYMWKSGEQSGVVAEAEIIGDVEPRTGDPDSVPFWREASEAATVADRALLQVRRVAGSKQVLRRDWFREDPALREMLIMRQPAGTNFPLKPEEAARLALMWSRVGLDWTRDESIAGLWAYMRTLGGEVSKKIGSPVADVSLLTGRSVPGVYNKVMNFRALDPADGRVGMKGGSSVDRDVWASFYDAKTGSIDKAALESEFNTVWKPVKDGEPLLDQAAIKASLDSEVKRLASRSLQDLLAAYATKKGAQPTGSSRPLKKVARTTAFDRDALVVAIAKKRADNSCEVPSCTHPTFLDSTGLPYCEVHHLQPLAEGGCDTIENVVCLCPVHHREVHLGKDAAGLREQLELVRT
jgi:hypothetical protein